MANVRDYININPIDIELDRAIGVPFPFDSFSPLALTL